MFITLEGIEGAGKTTQMESIAGFFQARGLPCITTREPGGTRIGTKIRSILLDSGHREMDPRTELLLYMADRAQHIREVILPAIQEGVVVVCDRYVDATVVYQGAARRLDPEHVVQLHRLVLGGLMPDVTFLLDLPTELGLARAWGQIRNGSRSERETRFEEEEVGFHEKIRRGYLHRSRQEPGRFRVIDASRPEAQVGEEIEGYLASLFP